MAKRKRTTFKSRRRTTGKRRRFRARRRRGAMSSIGKTNPFPKRFSTTLRYEEDLTLNPGLGTMACNVFRAGSCFDPNFTGIGHQPRYFDEIMANYNHYVVIGSKITAICANGQNDAVILGIQMNANGATVATFNDLCENRNSVYTWVGEQNSTQLGRVRMKYSPKKFLSRSHPLSDPDLKGTLTTNPNENAFFSVCVAAHDPGVDIGNVVVRVIIDYIVVFIEPKTVAQS